MLERCLLEAQDLQRASASDLATVGLMCKGLGIGLRVPVPVAHIQGTQGGDCPAQQVFG